MKYAIWGSKHRASKLAACIDQEIDFFIDNDLSRQGMLHGKPIISPKNIQNWQELYIYLPSNIYAEVAPLLLEKGLRENIDFIVCPIETKRGISFERIRHHLKRCEMDFQEMNSTWKETIIFFSCIVAQGNPYGSFVARMIKQGIPVSIVSENYLCDRDSLSSIHHVNFRCFEMVPVIDSDIYVVNGRLTKNQMDSIVKDSVLYNAMLCHREWCHCKAVEDLSTDPSCCMIYVMKIFAELFVQYIQPAKVICHGSSIPFHIVLEHICKLHGVPVGFTHEGVIPGTYVIESEGEMGHSLPAIYSERFISLPVSKEEIEHTWKVWNYLFRSKLNRKIQPNNNCLAHVNSRLKKDQPTIFFAGQNDIGSHMVPYTEITKKYHSPIFQSSLEAAIYLANICAKYGWNFIYKPHPDYVQSEKADKLPPNTIFITKGDINALIDISDVTVTILSTTSYNALIRKKPVVMLGYNQTKGKRCTYEAFEKDNIEGAIKDALANGFTQDQQDAFLRHMAQCLKYYLYDDLQERPIRYGRPVPKSIDEFYELERLLKEE